MKAQILQGRERPTPLSHRSFIVDPKCLLIPICRTFSRKEYGEIMRRRTFIKMSLAALALSQIASARRSLRILILGGTGFIGPHQVEAALGRGHEVTLFNRGKTSTTQTPGVETLIGDRETDLSALKGRKWDAVIDNSRDQPGWVRKSTSLLKGSVNHYLYVSSISAYADFSQININEEASLHPPSVDGKGHYGMLKVRSEELVQDTFPTSHTILRPGLIVGPGDPTDRFTYWPVRIERGGDVLAPGSPTTPTQFIDARDLAIWTIRAMEEQHLGIYNLTGPNPPLTMGTFLETIERTVSSDARLVWVDTSFLEKRDIQLVSAFPLWVPSESESRGFTSIDISKALASGLTFRSLESTILDTLAWYRSQSHRDEKLKAGLSEEKEAAILKEWSQMSR